MDIPSVPGATMTNGVPKPYTGGGSGGASRAGLGGALNATSDSTITVEPGVTQIAAIARGHLNRIITPFPNPEVMTSNLVGGKDGECGEICVRDNVIYVTTDSNSPVTISINETGRQDIAILLTLVPKDVPPRELALNFSGSAGQAISSMQFGSSKADSWEKSQPYVTTLTQLFRKLALNEVPQGYTLHDAKNGPLPVCYQQGVSYDFARGQRMMGHNLDVSIGVAQNQTSSPVEIRESACGSPNVAAVAAWPHNVLAPGQKTEIYVATKRGRNGGAPTTQRPSLVR